MAQENLVRLLLDEPLQRGRADAPAVREPKRVWSYAKLAEEAGRAGSALAALNIGGGERVALLMHDSADMAAIFLGAVRIGAVPVPIPILARPLEARAMLVDSGATAAVVSADLAAVIEEVRDEVPSLKRLLAVGGARPGQEDFHALCRAADPICPVQKPAEGSPAFLLYSQGIGGVAKGVAHPHEAAQHAYAAYAASVLRLTSDDRLFATATLATAYGLGLGLLFPLQAGACTFLLPDRPRPRTVFDVMTTFRPTVFAASPSLYGQMVHDYRELGGIKPACFESVRHAVSGAEALPAPLEQRVKETFGVELLHGFGMTESLHFVLSNLPGSKREGSAGQALPGVEARIVDDAGTLLPAHEIGSLEVRGPTVVRGYWGRPPDGDAAFHDGWIRSGDRCFVDKDGFFYHCGRADDLFKVSGRWVSPEEVERTLLAHPAVWECAVVEGHDDEDGLARPVAFVVPNVGHAPTTDLAQQLMEFVKREIAPYKYPREIEFVESLPKSASGQILRWRLHRRSGGKP
jgi:benzoate-CoA ligase family protein